MRKPHVICAHEASILAAVHPRLLDLLGDRFVVSSLDAWDATAEHLAELKSDGAQLAVVAVNEAWHSTRSEWTSVVKSQFANAIPVVLPKAEAAGASTTEAILDRFRDPIHTFELRQELEAQKRALELRNQQLESLNDVGTAMSGSFDIAFILEQIHRAVSRLVGEIPIDIFYAGCSSINSRPRWHPMSGSIAGNLTESERMKLETKISLAVDKPRSQQDDQADSNLETLLQEYDRIAIPIAYKEDLLGMVLFKSQSPPTPETARFLSILNLQAATALRNIHLTQERIRFERLAAFGHMIGSLVHDFRSPLTAVRGYAAMLANAVVPEAERATYGRYLLEECDRLNRMIQELLEFTRGKQSSLSLTRFELGDYLQEFPARVAAQYPKRAIEISLELDYQGPITGDRERLDRAFWNVLNNACQALHGQGRIIIQTHRQDNQLVIAFSDDGPGIPDAVRHRIFEPFFSYGKVEGIGLGMAIASRIVEEHGGNIQLDSQTGHGTKVVFELPVIGTGPPSDARPMPGSQEVVTGA